MVIITVMLLKTAAMETKHVLIGIVIFRLLFGSNRFHLCVSCFDTVTEKVAGSRAAKFSCLSMKVRTRMRSLCPNVKLLASPSDDAFW